MIRQLRSSALHISKFMYKETYPQLLVSLLIRPDFTWHTKTQRKVLTPSLVKDVPPVISRPADVLRVVMLWIHVKFVMAIQISS